MGPRNSTCDHRVGSLVRPHGYPQAGGGRGPRGSHHRRRWRRRLDCYPARPHAHQSHGSGDRLAPRDDELGQGSRAHHVIDHGKPIAAQVAALGLGAPGFVFSTTHTADHLKEIVELIAPQGRLALINNEPLELALLMRKCVSIHWESMFTRSMLQTADMAEQHALLDNVAELVDAGKIRTTVAEHFGTINAANLKRAHVLLETGKARGKIVLEGFA